MAVFCKTFHFVHSLRPKRFHLHFCFHVFQSLLKRKVVNKMNFRTIFDSTNKIWSGDGASGMPKYDSRKSLGSVLLDVLQRYPDKIGQISGNNGIEMTNGEIRWRSIRVAQNLTKLGIGLNDVVQVIASNHHYLAPIIFGLLTIGAPINAIDAQFTKDEIVHMLQLAKPKLIVCDLSIVETLKGALLELQMDRPIFVFDGSSDGIQNVEALFDETDVDSFVAPLLDDAYQHTAAIVCTSGTTGLPKGVCLPHVALLAKCNNDALGLHDVMLNFSSLYWLTGWATLLMGTLKSSTRIITTKPFTSQIWLEIVQRHKVTMTLTPPHFLALILQDPKLNTTDITSLKMFFCTGGMVSDDVCDRMNKRLKNGVVFLAYAMSETAGFISTNISALRPGSVGQLYPGFEAKIINDNGDKCGIGEDGEIYFKTMYKFTSYYGDVENTIKTMDSDGWIQTGDVGHFDDAGFLYLVDRRKEILKYFSSQVSPSELENVLMQHPGIANVCVVGIRDDASGDLPAAVIIKSTIGIDATEEEINKLMKTKLSNPKQLRGGIYFVDHLPVTPSGKVVRRKVQEIATKYYNEKSH